MADDLERVKENVKEMARAWKAATEETPRQRRIFMSPQKLYEKLYSLLADRYEERLMYKNCMNRHWDDMSNEERVLTSQYKYAKLLRRGRSPDPERPQDFNALQLIEMDRHKLEKTFDLEYYSRGD